MGRIRNKIAYELDKLNIRFNRLAIRLMRPPIVLSIEETIETIIEKKASISRFGDGEFDHIFHKPEDFQRPSHELGRQLRKILKKNNISDRFLVAIPDCFEDLSHFTDEAAHHWRIRLDRQRWKWYRLLNRKYPYYHAQISRFYIDWIDKNKSRIWSEMLKKIWEGRNILIVEGTQTLMGVGNNLFDESLSIRRILCPAKNSFERYETILETIKSNAKADDLILLALGPTASILAYDLYKEGFQAVDIGHVDLEYEWMLRNSTTKERIPGRFINEIDGGRYIIPLEKNSDYENQIVSVIS